MLRRRHRCNQRTPVHWSSQRVQNQLKDTERMSLCKGMVSLTFTIWSTSSMRLNSLMPCMQIKAMTARFHPFTYPTEKGGIRSLPRTPQKCTTKQRQGMELEFHQCCFVILAFIDQWCSWLMYLQAKEPFKLGS